MTEEHIQTKSRRFQSIRENTRGRKYKPCQDVDCQVKRGTQDRGSRKVWKECDAACRCGPTSWLVLDHMNCMYPCWAGSLTSCDDSAVSNVYNIGTYSAGAFNADLLMENDISFCATSFLFISQFCTEYTWSTPRKYLWLKTRTIDLRNTDLDPLF